jgi:hypothetical protein
MPGTKLIRQPGTGQIGAKCPQIGTYLGFEDEKSHQTAPVVAMAPSPSKFYLRIGTHRRRN